MVKGMLCMVWFRMERACMGGRNTHTHNDIHTHMHACTHTHTHSPLPAGSVAPYAQHPPQLQRSIQLHSSPPQPGARPASSPQTELYHKRPEGIYVRIKVWMTEVWMTIVESGWNTCVWLMCVVSRRWAWLVGGIYGCGYNV